jgi:hypothetical protein
VGGPEPLRCPRVLRRSGEPVHGLDADDRRDHRIFEAVIGIAEEFLHRLGVEAAGDLLGGGDHEFIAGGLQEAAALEFVLERLALGLGAFQHGVGTAELIGERFQPKWTGAYGMQLLMEVSAIKKKHLVDTGTVLSIDEAIKLKLRYSGVNDRDLKKRFDAIKPRYYEALRHFCHDPRL